MIRVAAFVAFLSVATACYPVSIDFSGGPSDLSNFTSDYSGNFANCPGVANTNGVKTGFTGQSKFANLTYETPLSSAGGYSASMDFKPFLLTSGSIPIISPELVLRITDKNPPDFSNQVLLIARQAPFPSNGLSDIAGIVADHNGVFVTGDTGQYFNFNFSDWYQETCNISADRTEMWGSLADIGADGTAAPALVWSDVNNPIALPAGTFSDGDLFAGFGTSELQPLDNFSASTVPEPLAANSLLLIALINSRLRRKRDGH